jgi:hypothetical protein
MHMPITFLEVVNARDTCLIFNIISSTHNLEEIGREGRISVRYVLAKKTNYI